LKKLVIAIYYHPEAYPPTLNAINELAKVFDEVYLLYSPHLPNCWVYPDNVKIHANGRQMTVKDQANLPVAKKIFLFAGFCILFLKLAIKHKPKMILVYDALPLLSYHLFKKFLSFNHKIWYHNHDILDYNLISKYSIAWLAFKMEKKAFKYLNIFSLPSEERKKYFNLKKFKGNFFFIPNYPSQKIYDHYYTEKKITKEAVLIYQGRITESHGLETITSLLNNDINGINLALNLKGIASNEFKQKILNIASANNTADKIKFLGMSAYIDVPIEGNKAHIGIGIFTNNDIMNSTLGTASNKLYEYAAMGLPVLYYDNDYFNKHLGDYNWAVKCKVNEGSILMSITYIIDNYVDLSRQAREDFNNRLNFERCFEPIIQFIIEKAL